MPSPSRTGKVNEELVNQPRGQALLGGVGAEDADVLAVGGGQGGGHGLGDAAGQQCDPRVGHVMVGPVGEDEHRPAPGPTL
jgi:hypothetical protein